MVHQDNLSSPHVGIHQQIQMEIVTAYLNSLCHAVQKQEQSTHKRNHLAQYHHSWDCFMLAHA